MMIPKNIEIRNPNKEPSDDQQDYPRDWKPDKMVDPA